MNSFSDKKSQLINKGRERERQREEKGQTEKKLTYLYCFSKICFYRGGRT
jgi:hypothetical protein